MEESTWPEDFWSEQNKSCSIWRSTLLFGLMWFSFVVVVGGGDVVGGGGDVFVHFWEGVGTEFSSRWFLIL
jgi:hypothetical protein